MMEHLWKTELHHGDACSQFSIAMVTGLPVEEIANEMGGWDGQPTRSILDFLIRKGFSNGDMPKAGETVNLDGTGILIIQTEREGHAVAYENGTVYDPNGHVFHSVQALCHYYSMFDNYGLTWKPRALLRTAPVKTREFEVGGKQNAEI